MIFRMRTVSSQVAASQFTQIVPNESMDIICNLTFPKRYFNICSVAVFLLEGRYLLCTSDPSQHRIRNHHLMDLACKTYFSPSM